MSLHGMFGREVRKKYKHVPKILTPESDKRFNIILIAWILIAYAIGNWVNAYNISFSDCGVCESVSQYLPAIEKSSVGSKYSEAMRFVWLYALVTSPLLLATFFVFVREFNRPILPIWGVTLFAVIGFFCLYACVVGIGFGFEEGERGGRYSRLYHNYLFFSTLIACANSGFVAITVFHLTHHFKACCSKKSMGSESIDF